MPNNAHQSATADNAPQQREAARLLEEIEAIGQAVRQSRLYQQASAALILWGALCAMGYLVTFFAPAYALIAWRCLWFFGVAGSIALGTFLRAKNTGQGAQRLAENFDFRQLAAFALVFAFGVFCSGVLGRFGPRELGVFWTVYFMLPYALAGLWMGAAFLVIGLSVALGAVAAYFWAGPWFDLWMAAINGGGLLLGGLWMRRS